MFWARLASAPYSSNWEANNRKLARDFNFSKAIWRIFGSNQDHQLKQFLLANFVKQNKKSLFFQVEFISKWNFYAKSTWNMMTKVGKVGWDWKKKNPSKQCEFLLTNHVILWMISWKLVLSSPPLPSLEINSKRSFRPHFFASEQPRLRYSKLIQKILGDLGVMFLLLSSREEFEKRDDDFLETRNAKLSNWRDEDGLETKIETLQARTMHVALHVAKGRLVLTFWPASVLASFTRTRRKNVLSQTFVRRSP